MSSLNKLNNLTSSSSSQKINDLDSFLLDKHLDMRNFIPINEKENLEMDISDNELDNIALKGLLLLKKRKIEDTNNFYIDNIDNIDNGHKRRMINSIDFVDLDDLDDSNQENKLEESDQKLAQIPEQKDTINKPHQQIITILNAIDIKKLKKQFTQTRCNDEKWNIAVKLNGSGDKIANVLIRDFLKDTIINNYDSLKSVQNERYYTVLEMFFIKNYKSPHFKDIKQRIFDIIHKLDDPSTYRFLELAMDIFFKRYHDSIFPFVYILSLLLENPYNIIVPDTLQQYINQSSTTFKQKCLKFVHNSDYASRYEKSIICLYRFGSEPIKELAMNIILKSLQYNSTHSDFYEIFIDPYMKKVSSFSANYRYIYSYNNKYPIKLPRLADQFDFYEHNQDFPIVQEYVKICSVSEKNKILLTSFSCHKKGLFYNHPYYLSILNDEKSPYYDKVIDLLGCSRDEEYGYLIHPFLIKTLMDDRNVVCDRWRNAYIKIYYCSFPLKNRLDTGIKLSIITSNMLGGFANPNHSFLIDEMIFSFQKGYQSAYNFLDSFFSLPNIRLQSLLSDLSHSVYRIIDCLSKLNSEKSASFLSKHTEKICRLISSLQRNQIILFLMSSSNRSNKRLGNKLYYLFNPIPLNANVELIREQFNNEEIIKIMPVVIERVEETTEVVDLFFQQTTELFVLLQNDTSFEKETITKKIHGYALMTRHVFFSNLQDRVFGFLKALFRLPLSPGEQIGWQIPEKDRNELIQSLIVLMASIISKFLDEPESTLISFCFLCDGIISCPTAQVMAIQTVINQILYQKENSADNMKEKFGKYIISSSISKVFTNCFYGNGDVHNLVRAKNVIEKEIPLFFAISNFTETIEPVYPGEENKFINSFYNSFSISFILQEARRNIQTKEENELIISATTAIEKQNAQNIKINKPIAILEIFTWLMDHHRFKKDIEDNENFHDFLKRRYGFSEDCDSIEDYGLILVLIEMEYLNPCKMIDDFLCTCFTNEDDYIEHLLLY